MRIYENNENASLLDQPNSTNNLQPGVQDSSQLSIEKDIPLVCQGKRTRALKLAKFGGVTIN